MAAAARPSRAGNNRRRAYVPRLAFRPPFLSGITHLPASARAAADPAGRGRANVLAPATGHSRTPRPFFLAGAEIRCVEDEQTGIMVRSSLSFIPLHAVHFVIRIIFFNHANSHLYMLFSKIVPIIDCIYHSLPTFKNSFLN